MPKDLVRGRNGSFFRKTFFPEGIYWWQDDISAIRMIWEDKCGEFGQWTFAGTEPSIIGTETWTRNGMYFFSGIPAFYVFMHRKWGVGGGICSIIMRIPRSTPPT